MSIGNFKMTIKSAILLDLLRLVPIYHVFNFILVTTNYFKLSFVNCLFVTDKNNENVEYLQ